MIARGFKPVAWVALIGVAALSCYMISLRVAAERAELANLDQRIMSTRQAIRSLQTELGTRGRLQQLEQWNADVLALAAPIAGQFLESNVSLARFDVREQGFAERQAEVRMAAATTPSTQPAPAAPATTTNTPRVVLAAAQTAAPKPAGQPAVRQLSLASAETPALAPRPAAAPARPPLLLRDDTLRDLRTEARNERGGTRN